MSIWAQLFNSMYKHMWEKLKFKPCCQKLWCLNMVFYFIYRLSLKIEPGNSSPRLVSSKEDLGGKVFIPSSVQFTFLKNSWKWLTLLFFSEFWLPVERWRIISNSAKLPLGCTWLGRWWLERFCRCESCRGNERERSGWCRSAPQMLV